MGLITLPNNFEKILDKTEKKKVKKVEIDDNNNNNNNTEDGDRIGLEVKARFFLLYRCHLGNLCWPLKNRDFELKGSPQSAPAWTVTLHHINVYKLYDNNTSLYTSNFLPIAFASKTDSHDLQQDLPCYGPATGDQRCGEVQFELF